jgi:hypothetical protein
VGAGQAGDDESATTGFAPCDGGGPKRSNRPAPGFPPRHAMSKAPPIAIVPMEWLHPENAAVLARGRHIGVLTLVLACFSCNTARKSAVPRIKRLGPALRVRAKLYIT